MTEKEDNDRWIESGRKYSALDNEAMARYFRTIAKLDGARRKRVVLAFEEATNEGWRPKWAVKRALAAMKSGV